MRKLALAFTVIVMGLSFSTQASAMEMDHSEEHNHPDTAIEAVEKGKTNITGDVHVNVNGLVCDFCARALEKVFGKQNAVNDIDVNLDTKIITIDFKDGQTLDDTTITQLITDSGYNVDSIHHVEH